MSSLIAVRILGALARGAKPIGLRRIADHACRKAVARRFVGPAHDMLNAGRSQDAETLLQRGLAVFPDDPDLLLAAASAARQDRRVAVAIEFGERALRAAPDHIAGYTMLASLLRFSGRPDRAQATIRDAKRRYPHAVSVLAEEARIAEDLGDLEGARAGWRVVCATPEPRLEWVQRHANILVLLNRLDEADKILDTALASCRTDGELKAASGLLAVRGYVLAARGDWTATVAHWTEFRTRFPGNPTGWDHLGRALFHQALSRMDHAAPASAAPAPPQQRTDVGHVADAAKKALLLRFESIGDSCEFGLVQRRYGAEPLGLLRWNSVTTAGLIAGLKEHLRGMGDPAHTEIVTHPNGELAVRDRRWGFDMHSWMFANQIEYDAFKVQMCRRVAFLRDKFLADLAAPEKVLVYRSSTIGLEDMSALHEALRMHGPVRLLVVVPVHAKRPFTGTAGGIRQLADDLCIGFIDRDSQNDNGTVDIAFDDWLSVCQAASDLWLGDRHLQH